MKVPVSDNERRRFLIASDFDQTLSFNDSGRVLSEILGLPDFDEKVAGLSGIALVQQGAELAYLLRHDPGFRRVRKEHLAEAGRQVRLKRDVDRLALFLDRGLDDTAFDFYVISAAPQEVVEAALSGLVPADHIFGTEFQYDAHGEISAVSRVPAGFGKVMVLDRLEARLQIPPEGVIYIGDGSSDLYVMQHVNAREGYTIAVSDSRSVARTARRTVLSDNALAALVPVMEDLIRWDSRRIRRQFASWGLALQDWDKSRTDRLTFHQAHTSAEI